MTDNSDKEPRRIGGMLDNGEAEESRDSDKSERSPLREVKRTSHHWSKTLKVGSGSILKSCVASSPRTTD
ncbi:uncharacterized protein N7496_002358 [Penicillium cataractarum]|uniref:Uncharacterized protein n=1 Tax=Penicillium cataractarum TaxID=2100454 RepID=A0A9W9VHS5_9EURO|nr:uncharacterized protein N7496_002358 [Penicillium cataractarum]KAJ5379930.1 hypothetical protein N7496_002358 [Penicillium cataractarum]